METPFYLWSISEAWGWLINLPFIGFLLLFPFFAGIVYLIFQIIIVGAGFFIWLDDRPPELSDLEKKAKKK